MRRVFALLQAAWLALLIAEPASLHACAMHASGHGSHATAAVVADVAAPATDEHAHHHAAVAENATPVDVPVDAPVDTSTDNVCQCLGECCASAVAALPSYAWASPATDLVAVELPAGRSAARSARAPDLRLPFSHAPPGPLTR